MNRLLPIAVLFLALAAGAVSIPARGQTRQCSLDSMSPAEKQALTAGYYRILREEGQARAEAWIKAQGAAFAKKLIAEGVCPPPAGAGSAPPQPRARVEDAPLRNRHGKTCKRIELENQNVPNLGGAMGWALIPVCKDE